jgi:ABC-type antimicrobial peptide transport system permease subunit
VARVNRGIALFDVRGARDFYRSELSQSRIATIVILAAAAFGMLLAAVGTYGVFSYVVARRTREIGIRAALGARPANVVWQEVRRGLQLTVAGVGIGVAGALVLARWMSGVLTEIAPRDPLTYSVVAVVLVITAVIACYIPARRATKVDPLVALRAE